MRRAVALLLSALVLAPLAAAAAKAPVFGLRAVGANKRGYFVYTMTPGTVKQGAVIVSNVGTAPGTVKLFVADGTTGSTSGTVYKTDSAPTATGKWVRLEKSSLTLRPGAHRTVRFTVHVPASAPAGEWVAGIVAEASRRVASQKPGSKARVQIRIRDQTIVAVQVNVPGPRVVAFQIGKVTTGGTRGFQKVIVRLESTGNVLAHPTGVVTILDSKGRVVETLVFRMDTFLPRTAIDYPVLLKKALPAGDYTASVRLKVPGGTTFAAKPGFSVSNEDVKQVFTSATPQAAPPTAAGTSSSGVPGWVWIALGVAAAAALLVLLGWLVAHRRRAAKRRPPPTTHLRAAPPEVAPDPEPQQVDAPEPSPPSPPPPPAAEPVPASTGHEHEHFWEVAYDRGVLGDDGAWRFP